MKRYLKVNLLILSILFSIVAISQLLAQTEKSNIFSDKNRLAFGNYLFCEHDYLRAVDEFSAVLKNSWNDTLQFKIAESYARMQQFNQAYTEFQKLEEKSALNTQGEYEKLRMLFKSENYSRLQKEVEKSKLISSNNYFHLLRLMNSSMLLSNAQLPPKSSFLYLYEEDDKSKIAEFYNWKQNPPYKSPTKAAIMSIIPGLGKIYANEIGDGITSFILTGLFTYLAVNKFEKQQQSSAWLYTAFAAFFYSGNIYGSVAAVQNYNAGIKFNFDNEIKVFINERNQFLPTPKFLCE
ncbi:MAG: hypothetical protein KKF62_16910 [Bacteroidetes bacterium]|nr:hypothetical protein [Bacteroidota bacterium]MBU1116156.1 hypothetical protein [Bacteroidota bacterium]MBU1800448.1 hypothetical protein [Bacteroidota bacterium]